MAAIFIDPGDYPLKEEELREAVNMALSSHPLAPEPLANDPTLKLRVRIDEWAGTHTDHYQYTKTGDLLISLHPSDIFDAGKYGRDYGRLGTRIVPVLYHELTHFIDARLRPEFRYQDDLRPTDERPRRIHHYLWCAYIDGRLGPSSPHDLAFRQRDASSRLRTEQVAKACLGGQLKTGH
jgi:hypothetical protein